MTPRFVLIAALLIALVSPAFGVGGGGAVCGRCEIPYPDMYEYADSSGMSMTPAEASSVCFEALDGLPYGMDFGGYVIRWVGSPPSSDEDTGRFFCYACINDPSVGGTTSGGAPYTIQQAGSVAQMVHPGRVSSIDTFVVDDPAYGLGTGYLVTLVDPGQGNVGDGPRVGMVRIDPFTGQPTVEQEVSAPNR